MYPGGVADDDSGAGGRAARRSGTTDDYTPKPALETYRALIDRHG
ncbi:hypothetical protein ABTX34_01325 [Streptomyces sp. NPDC096538]|nr:MULTISPECIES: hypothetical protein [unclassified Streptomyces]MDU0302289.1 hypothetical protein [Streptomyces sp. PAL114]